MKKHLPKILLITGLFCWLWVIYHFHINALKFENKCQIKAVNKITRNINKANVNAEELLQKLNINNFKSIANDFNKKGLELIVREGETTVFWTSNTVPLFKNILLGNYYFKNQKNLYRLYTKRISDSLVATAFFKIKYAFPKNDALVYKINPSLFNHLKADFFTEKIPESLELKVEGSKNPLYVKFIGNPRNIDHTAWILLGFVLLIFSGIYSQNTFNNKHLHFLLFYILYLFGVILLSYSFSETTFFKPYIYASSWYFSSLGHLFALMLIISPLLIYLTKNWVGKVKNKLLIVLFGFIHLGITGFVVAEIVKLLKDSKISFSFYQVGELNIYTFIALFCMALGLYLVHLVYKILFVNTSVLDKISNYPLILLGQISTFLLLLFIFNNDIMIMSISFFYNLLWILIPKIKQLNNSPFLRGVVRIVLACIVISICINNNIGYKELELRKLLATRLSYMEDDELINDLKLLDNKIHYDNSVADYLTCETGHQIEFEQHLQNVYFSGYINNYNVKIIAFDSNKNSYPGKGKNDYNLLENNYLNLNKNNVTDHFVSLSKQEGATGYLGKFEICDTVKTLGYLFIEISPKVGFNFVKYTHFWEPNSQLESKTGVASFAIYQNNKLVRRSGGFPYPLNYGILPNDKKSSEFISNKYTHYVAKQDSYNFVTSNPSRTWAENVSTFIFLILMSMAIWVFLNIIPVIPLGLLKRYNKDGKFDALIHYLELKFKTFNPSKMFLTNRISLAMLGTVYLIIFISIGFSMNYEDSNFEVRHKDYLRTKLYDIVNIIKDNNDFEDIMVKHNYNSLYKLSEHFKNDIRIYNSNGVLEFSTDTKIFDLGISNKMCNPIAYKMLKDGKKSEFTHKEKLGEVQYFAAYYTLLDDNLKTKGYLNLPYFSKTKEFEEETGTYLALFINLFGFLFLLAGVIAWYISKRISKPLIDLRNHIGKLSDNNKYQPVPWEINDEIGLLVKEYNEMLIELEKNSKLLAQTERESAWRDMAKQVAHEIKNPLTPMKLSLQHLQRSFTTDDNDNNKRFLKTTNMLIERIDALSNMAEEFSIFAQMPKSNPEKFSLNSELESICQLYENTPNFKVEFKPINPEVTIETDKQALNRVFINLAKNAQQATAEKEGELIITVKIENKKVIISFKDNGVGIPNELQSRIFTPKFSTKNSGMGLGLAMSKKIIKSINGDISFESTEGNGAEFFIEIPN